MTARYDARTALVVVDVQNDFALPTGSLSVPGGEDVVEPINREIDAAVSAGATVAYTQDWHPSDTPHFAKDGGVWPVHCVAGTAGAELHAGLRRVDEAPVVRKGVGGEDGYSGFTVRDPSSGGEAPTELAALLLDRGVQRLVVVGLATDYCVKATAIDGAGLGFDTTVLADAVRAVDVEPGDGVAALEEMRAAGVIVEG